MRATGKGWHRSSPLRTKDVDTVLVAGMVVSMEPMVMIPEGEAGAGGYREHDILVLTDTGADNLTGFPFGPEHHIIGA